MKTLCIFCLSLFFTSVTFAQYVIQADEEVELKNDYRKNWIDKQRRQATNPSGNKAGICDTDTLAYGQFKSSSTRFISLRTPNSASGYGQFFPVDDTVLVHGFIFYAYAQNFFGSETGTASLYFANSQRIPVGNPLRTETVTIPWNSAVLSIIKQTVIFSTPYEATHDFVVALESPTTGGINVATSNWDSLDGGNINYVCAKFATGWVRGSNITIGTPPIPFNADAFLEPIVSYKLKSNFDVDNSSCLGNGKPFLFTNTSTPIMDEGYNPHIIDSTNDYSFEWEYGDGSPVDSVEHGLNTYSSIGVTSYNVRLVSEFSGYSMPNSCKDTYNGVIEKPDLQADFTTSINLGVVQCTDKSVDAKEWRWDFGDGATDTVQSPSHTYSASGIYTIKQWASSKGCIDSALSTVQIVSTGINELQSLGIQLYPNPTSSTVHIDLSQYSGASIDELTLSWFNFVGQRVKEEKVVLNGQRLFTTSIATLSKGSYLLKIHNGGQIVIGSAVVTKD